MVYVLNINGKPLMPTKRHGKVRHLLENGQAKVVCRTPFTIQMTYSTKTHYTQPITLGVDAGSKTIGLSASTEREELFAAEVKPRSDVVNNLSTRREFRRARRNRKTRYRQPRFDNRTHSKHKGWLASSVEVKIQEHITSILRVMRILPITNVVVETAEFDLQLIKAVLDGKPVPEGEDYQKGEMLGFYNVRQYVFWRDNYTCQHCGAHGDGVKLEAHHLESRKTGGNAPDVFRTLCSCCHEKVSKGVISLKDATRKRRSTRDAAFMGIMRKEFVARLRILLKIPVRETKGYITKCIRETNKVPKSHTNDALCIAGHPTASRIQRTYIVRPVRHHNRQLHRATILKGGIRKRNQAATYVKGFRLYDKVCYQGAECFVWGRRSSGSFLLRTIDGKRVKDGVGYKHLVLLGRSSNYLIA